MLLSKIQFNIPFNRNFHVDHFTGLFINAKVRIYIFTFTGLPTLKITTCISTVLNPNLANPVLIIVVITTWPSEKLHKKIRSQFLGL